MTTIIPQHDLYNNNGKAMLFHLQEWGGADGYNTHHVHRHKFHEILFFRTGGGVHDIDYTAHAIVPGAIHFVASDNVHLLARSKSTQGCSLMFVTALFPAELLQQLPFNSNLPVLHADEVTLAPVIAMLHIIANEILQEYPGYEQVARMQIHTLLLLLARLGSGRNIGNKQMYTPHVTAFLELIKKHYKAHYTVEHYAEMLHVSAKHLIEVCKKQTGSTPLQLIRQLVTTEAKRLLYHTGMPVKEVAYQLNFDDPAAFSKYFKAVCGYGPAAFREGK